MSQQWLLKDNHQAQQEFTKKEQILKVGILVLIEQTVYHFEDKKEWETWQGELSKSIIGLYAWTNLNKWQEWLNKRSQITL
jgi:hypothetical protein